MGEKGGVERNAGIAARPLACATD